MFRYALIALIVAALGGCALKAPPATQEIRGQSLPNLAVPPQWAEQGGAAGAVVNGWLATFDDPRLEVAYDVANAEFVSEDHAEALRRLAPRLGQVHLSDATATRWAHDRVGSGTVDFDTVFQALDEIAFGGACILEVVTPTPVPDMVASIEALASGGPAKLPLVDTGRTG